jgi:hypothetical protein
MMDDAVMAALRAPGAPLLGTAGQAGGGAAPSKQASAAAASSAGVAPGKAPAAAASDSSLQMACDVCNQMVDWEKLEEHEAQCQQHALVGMQRFGR